VFSNEGCFCIEYVIEQSFEDATGPWRHEIIIEGLENKIKDQAAALEKKDFELQTMEGLLAEAEAKIAKLDKELLSKSKSFEQEKQKFDTKFEVEVEKSSNLQKIIERASRKISRVQQPMRAAAKAGL
jgi:predicted RNase H-like nuclease (RuvC/YqgF family)